MSCLWSFDIKSLGFTLWKCQSFLQSKVIRCWKSYFYRNISNYWHWDRLYFANHVWWDWCSWMFSRQNDAWKPVPGFRLKVYGISLQFVFICIWGVLFFGENLGKLFKKTCNENVNFPCNYGTVFLLTLFPKLASCTYFLWSWLAKKKGVIIAFHPVLLHNGEKSPNTDKHPVILG